MKTLLFLVLFSVITLVCFSQQQKKKEPEKVCIKDCVKESHKTKQLIDSLIMKIEAKKWKRKEEKKYGSANNIQAKLNK